MAEQGSEQRKYKITPPIISIPKGPAKDNPNERPPKEALREKSYAQGTKGPKKTSKIRKPSDLTPTTRQVVGDSKTASPEKELKVKENSQENIRLGVEPGVKTSYEQDSLSSDSSEK